MKDTSAERQRRWYNKQKRKRGIIYCITNKKSGRKFIGVATNSLRKVIYLVRYKCKQPDNVSRLAVDFREYGEENFIFRVIHFIKEGENKQEVLNKYIKQYNPRLNSK